MSKLSDDPVYDRTRRAAFYVDMPVIDLPITRIFEHWNTQQSTRCADYELDYYRCANQVGLKRGETECRRFWEDLLECQYSLKSVKRWNAMQKERSRQKKPYESTPPADSYPGEYSTRPTF